MRWVQPHHSEHAICARAAVQSVAPAAPPPVNYGALGKAVWCLYTALGQDAAPSRPSRESIASSGEQARSAAVLHLLYQFNLNGLPT